jgi:hypothetical protein
MTRLRRLALAVAVAAMFVLTIGSAALAGISARGID